MSPGQQIIHLAKAPRTGFPVCGASSFNWKLPRQTSDLQLVTCDRCRSFIEHGQQGSTGGRVTNAATAARKAEPKPRRRDGRLGLLRVPT